jgi:hypothetical protein
MGAAVFLYKRSDKLCLYANDVRPSVFKTLSYPDLTEAEYHRLLSDVEPAAYPTQLFKNVDIRKFDPRIRDSLLLGFSGLRLLSFIS